MIFPPRPSETFLLYSLCAVITVSDAPRGQLYSNNKASFKCLRAVCGNYFSWQGHILEADQVKRIQTEIKAMEKRLNYFQMHFMYIRTSVTHHHNFTKAATESDRSRLQRKRESGRGTDWQRHRKRGQDVTGGAGTLNYKEI